MARVLVTGSTQGLGLMAAQRLAGDGHEVTVHARDDDRAERALAEVRDAEGVVVGDLSSIAEIRGVAEQANASGRFDAVIHNAAVGYREKWMRTVDGLEHVFAVNVLAPYLLTAMMTRPDRLIYLSSAMHHDGDPTLSDPQWLRRRWNGAQAYSDSKLYDLVLAFGVARRWPDVLSNGVEPGWVPTRMGGSSAPDDLAQGHLTQVWLAVSDEPGALVTGAYFYHRRRRSPEPVAREPELQDALLDYCAQLTGVGLPRT
ncbi:MAG TPA: SDR family NAD(P)-dependent oxidoreductase [Kineosporiaceae bacterium]|nr:SDR family NAD(P)-dependent oxidoreductase [Kineosporiaceae bacterium]